MAKLETTEEFVLKLYARVSGPVKEMVKNEFQVLFGEKLELGKWYKNQNALCFYASEESQYGMHGGGDWLDVCAWMTYVANPSTQWTLATPEEIESMLFKEAEKRGLGKDTKIERCLFDDNGTNAGIFLVTYILSMDCLFNKNG